MNEIIENGYEGVGNRARRRPRTAILRAFCCHQVPASAETKVGAARNTRAGSGWTTRSSGDIADPAFPDGFCTGDLAAGEGLDGLVNNAGVTHRGTVLNADEDWARVMDVSHGGNARFTRDALRNMTRVGRGNIVISRRTSCRCRQREAVIARSRGRDPLTRAMDRTMGPAGIRVNAVGPGDIREPHAVGREGSNPPVRDCGRSPRARAPLFRLGRVGSDGSRSSGCLSRLRRPRVSTGEVGRQTAAHRHISLAPPGKWRALYAIPCVPNSKAAAFFLQNFDMERPTATSRVDPVKKTAV